jgi:hypothetical protein
MSIENACFLSFGNKFYNSKHNLEEKDQLLEIHLLEKTARHQNLNCSTLFEQMPKNETAQKTPKKSFQADAIFRPK